MHLFLLLKAKLLKQLVKKHMMNGYNSDISQEVNVDLTTSTCVFSKTEIIKSKYNQKSKRKNVINSNP